MVLDRFAHHHAFLVVDFLRRVDEKRSVNQTNDTLMAMMRAEDTLVGVIKATYY